MQNISNRLYKQLYFSNTAYLTALRAMMIISCILGGVSFAMMGASLDCNANIEANQRRWIRRVSGVMLVVAGRNQAGIRQEEMFFLFTLYLPSLLTVFIRWLTQPGSKTLRHARQMSALKLI